jgi:hypothetical protein
VCVCEGGEGAREERCVVCVVNRQSLMGELWCVHTRAQRIQDGQCWTGAMPGGDDAAATGQPCYPSRHPAMSPGVCE